MGLQLTYTFVSGKADGADSTLVKPSNWNALRALGPDVSVCFIKDDFVRGGIGASVGELPWGGANVGSGTLNNASTTVYPNIGTAISSAGATASSSCRLSLDQNNPAGTLGILNNFTRWIFKCSQVANAATTMFMDCGNGNLTPPNHGIGIEFNGPVDASNFRMINRAAAVSTAVTTLAADTSFHKVRIRSTTAGTLGFTADSSAEVTSSTNVPTANLFPFMMIANKATAAHKNFQIDPWAFLVTGLTR